MKFIRSNNRRKSNMSGRQWQRWKGIMKAYPLEEKRLAKWQPPYIVQPKFDGDRCRAIKLASGSFILLSSEENIFSSVPHINKLFDTNSSILPPEFDGELYSHHLHKEGGHELIHSIVSRTVNLHPRYEEMQFHLFDIPNQDIQAKRLIQVKNFPLKDDRLVLAPYYICNNLDDVLRSYDLILSQGYEGIIVRNIENFYERKRSTLVMKFKPKQQDEYVICGFKEEVDQYGTPKDTLGSLTCKSGNGSTFDVGTGFTDDLRKHFWDARQLLIGATAVVKYQHITSGNKVPRFPVFVKIVHNT
jgi:DNA ligase 1